MKYLPPSQLRKVKIDDSMEKIIIIKNGEAVAVLMSVKEYKSLHSLAALAADPERCKRIIEKHEAFQRGEREGLVEYDDIDQDAPGGPKLKEPKDSDK